MALPIAPPGPPPPPPPGQPPGPSIQLSVILNGLSEDRLSKVGLDDPWQDMMKDMTFSFKKPPIEMADLSYRVEEFIEKIYQERYGDQGGQLQVQVSKITNQAETKQFDWADNVDQYLKPGDTVVMELQAHATAEPQQQFEITAEVIKQVRSVLRFDLNDRVLCYCGPRWFSGHIVGTAVPDDGRLLPYLVKTDAIPGCPPRTISVPTDNDGCCMQEVCFHPTEQIDLVRCAAAVINGSRKPELRFAHGEKVVCRIQNDPNDGLEKWVSGCISEIWPNIGDASWDLGEVSGKFPDSVPYKIDLGSGKWHYCHRDNHTLVRREGMQPVTRVWGMSKRMETLKEADGCQVRIDHVTERRKRMLEAISSSDGDSD